MNIEGLDLNLLLVLEALLEERSVSRAARRIGLSQPAASNALARLRLALGDPLFRRTHRGIQPTPRAEQLAPGIRLGLARLRAALTGDTAFDPATGARTFRIGLADSCEWLLAPALAQALRDCSPGVRVHFRRLEGLFAVPETDLRSGVIDLAVGYFPDARALPEGLNSEDLFEEPQRVVLRRGHPAARRPLTLPRFAALEHAAVIYRSEPWGLVDAELAARGLRRNLRIALPHFSSLLAVAAASDLVGMVPLSIANLAARQFGLVARASPLPMPPFVTRVVWRQADHAEAAHRWLRQLVRGAAEASRPPAPGRPGRGR